MKNVSEVSSNAEIEDVFVLLRVSSYWSNIISAIVTIVLGILISLMTGGSRGYQTRLHLTSNVFVRLWRKMKLIPSGQAVTENRSNELLRSKENARTFKPEEVLKLSAETIV
ncbi:unnamed protein product [Ixodes persulcatus]